ncbi:hypothetical protein GTP56_05380 [Duganella sp. FT134W]|uniref:SEC-C domain-containing protein n=1 Tax=Duganella margarita TaxID=2692170 RepID=A0A7X4GXV7_9BURK|nr:hypothetical protein [Duganella margarita]MYM71628.1 hypothetical protein [Duganella margarita]
MPDFNDNVSGFSALVDMAGMLSPLDAVEFPADVYSPCWCGSNKKWKFCHKGRDKKSRAPIGLLLKDKEQLYRSGFCLHPEASSETCSTAKAIDSHTVQRRGGLDAIAEDGHVYSIKKGFSNVAKNNGRVDMERHGVARASTFPGYCNSHDTTLFKPVETKGAILNDMNGFLLSLRVVAYELASKRAELRSHIESRDDADCGVSFEQQVTVQSFMHFRQKALERGLADISAYKSKFDEAYLTQNFEDFSLYGVEFDGTLPFVVAGAFMPEYDFSGKAIQSLRLDQETSLIALNVTELNGKTWAVFGWYGGPSCAAAKFVDSFKSLPESEKANAVLLASLEYLENIYFKQSWWDSLSEELSSLLHVRIGGGMTGSIRSPNSLVAPGLGALTAPVVSIYEKLSK